MGDEIRVTLIATGFDQRRAPARSPGGARAPAGRPRPADRRPPARLARDPRRRSRHPAVPSLTSPSSSPARPTRRPSPLHGCGVHEGSPSCSLALARQLRVRCGGDVSRARVYSVACDEGRNPVRWGLVIGLLAGLLWCGEARAGRTTSTDADCQMGRRSRRRGWTPVQFAPAGSTTDNCRSRWPACRRPRPTVTQTRFAISGMGIQRPAGHGDSGVHDPSDQSKSTPSKRLEPR